jgi:phosphocarrier protein HPr
MATEGASGVLKATARICNEKGLHARASAKFVKLAESFDAQIRVAREGAVVAGTSIMGLLTLGAGPGSEIEIEAEGREAGPALKAVLALIARGFDEE